MVASLPSYSLVHFICFTDEKLFTVASPSNTQNDRMYVTVCSSWNSKEIHAGPIAAVRLLLKRPTFSKSPGMLILVLVLKDFLRTFFKSLSLSWPLGVRSLSLSLSLGVRVQEVLVLVLVLGGQVLVLILVLVV